MRRILTFICAITLVLCSVGCSTGSSLQGTVTFYYTRPDDSFIYGAEDGVISAEEREASGHAGELQYLLTLYLRGPLDDALTSPFPNGTQLTALTQTADTLYIELSGEFSQLSGVRLTTACACISKTCFALRDVSQVTIQSPAFGDHPAVEMTLTRDSLFLLDDSAISGSKD